MLFTKSLCQIYPKKFSTSFNSCKLNYIKYTSPSPDTKLNLIVLHGMLGSSKNFRSVVKDPSISKYANSILVDLRNHGDSCHKDTMTLEDMAVDVATLINELNLVNPVLLGHSLGGRVAMKCCLQYPGLFKGVLIVDILPINYYDKKSKFYWVSEMETLLQGLANLDLNRSINEIRIDIKKYEKNDDVVNFVLTNIDKIGPNKHKWRCNIKAIMNNFNSFINEIIYTVPNQTYNGKFKAILGEKSDYSRISAEDSQTFEQVFHNFNVKEDVDIIKDGGHWVHFDKPYLFAESVSKFLAKV